MNMREDAKKNAADFNTTPVTRQHIFIIKVNTLTVMASAFITRLALAPFHYDEKLLRSKLFQTKISVMESSFLVGSPPHANLSSKKLEAGW